MPYWKDFVLNSDIAKALGFTDGMNSTMFSTNDQESLRNVRNSMILTCAFGSKDLVTLEDIMTVGNTGKVFWE